jgi:hypothetical protein
MFGKSMTIEVAYRNSRRRRHGRASAVTGKMWLSSSAAPIIWNPPSSSSGK